MFKKRLVGLFILLALLIFTSGCINNKEDKFIDSNTSLTNYGNKTTNNNNKILIHDDFVDGRYDDWIVESNKWDGKYFRSPIPEMDKEKDDLRFTVKGGASAGSPDSLSKIYYKSRNRLSYGTYTARFKINRVPTDNMNDQVYFGMGLWEFGKKNDQANEVMMGYYLIYNEMKNKWDDRLQILTRRDGGHSKVSQYDPDLTASAFVNTFHTIEFIYTPDKVVGIFDGKPVLEKTDYIPSAPMSLIIGTRLAEGTPLSEDFDVTFDYVRINANIK